MAEDGKGKIVRQMSESEICQSTCTIRFVDRDGKILENKDWSQVGNFGPEGLAPVKTIEGWLYVDRNGKGVIGPAFDEADRKSTRLNSSHVSESRMPSSA